LSGLLSQTNIYDSKLLLACSNVSFAFFLSVSCTTTDLSRFQRKNQRMLMAGEQLSHGRADLAGQVLKLTLEGPSFEATASGEKCIEARDDGSWIRSRLYDRSIGTCPRKEFGYVKYYKGGSFCDRLWDSVTVECTGIFWYEPVEAGNDNESPDPIVTFGPYANGFQESIVGPTWVICHGRVIRRTFGDEASVRSHYQNRISPTKRKRNQPSDIDCLEDDQTKKASKRTRRRRLSIVV
jgi:hypothetical protein